MYHHQFIKLFLKISGLSFFKDADKIGEVQEEILFKYDLDLTVPQVGYMDTEMVKEFFYAVSYAAGMNLHIKVLHGANNHHIMEAMFKAFAKALDQATTKDLRITNVLSTKGIL